MNGTAKRFLFEQDFGSPARTNGTASHAHEEAKAAETMAALQTRFDEGRMSGMAEAHASLEAQAAHSLMAISDTMRLVSQSLDRELARIESDSIQMAATLARLYADALLDRDPAPVIAEAVRKCSEMANNAPMLAITISEGAPKGVRSAITEAAREVGFHGQLILKEDATLSAGDIRITWPDGGYLRERSRIDAIIRALIEDEMPGRHRSYGDVA